MRLLLLITLLLCSCALSEHAGRARIIGPEPDLAGATQDSGSRSIPVTGHAEETEQSDDSPVIASAVSLGVLVGAPASEAPAHAIPIAYSNTRHLEAESGTEENLMPKKRWNRLSVPAFVAAQGTICLGLFTSSTYAVIAGLFVTLVLAGFSLRQIRHRQEAGKGFAFAALMIGVIATLITALTIARYGLE